MDKSGRESVYTCAFFELYSIKREKTEVNFRERTSFISPECCAGKVDFY